MLSQDWQQRIGQQRDWSWRGWQVRYSFWRSPPNLDNSTPPLILIHGFGASIEHWRKNIPVLGEYQTIYAIDLLGFGGSRKAATAYTVDLWVEQIHDFWQAFIGQPAVLVGNSIGSLVCLGASAAYPQMSAGVVLLSVPDVASRQEVLPKRLLPIIRTMEKLFASPLLLRPLFSLLRRPDIIRKWAGIAYCDQTQVDGELVEIIATPPQDEGSPRTFCLLCRAVNEPHFAPSAQTILQNLSIPILLIWGLGDRMVPPLLAPRLAQLNPRIQLVELEQVGHCPHDEAPEQFNSILLQWLGQNYQ